MRWWFSFFMFFGVCCFAENALVRQVLQEVNETQPVQIELLKSCPEVIPVLADWAYEDWSRFDASLTKERLIQNYSRRLSEEIPLTLVALKEGMPVGLVTLKAHEALEFADLENGNPWIGSLHIRSDERGQGIGELLAKSIALIAKRMGYQEIRFYLSEKQGVDWCIQRGAEIFDTRPFRGHTVDVLRFDLNRV